MNDNDFQIQLDQIRELAQRTIALMPKRVNASVREGHLHDLSYHKNYAAGGHAAVTMSGAYTYITLVGQDIVRGQITLTTDVTGRLPYANIVAATAISKLLGRGSAAGAGDWQEITLGTNLSMSGTTLNATGGGAPTTAPYITFGLDAGLSNEYSISETDESTLADVDIHWKWTSVTPRAYLIECTSAALTVQFRGGSSGLEFYNGVETTPRVYLFSTSAALFFGDGTNPLDVKLYRAAADVLATDDNFRMASAGKVIQDSGGNTRISLSTASPHITLTGDVVITGSGSGATAAALNFTSTTAPFYGITMSQSLTGGTYTGINISPTLTSNANGTVITGIQGLAQMLINAHTGVFLSGLDFQARASPASGTTLGTVSTMYALKATADARITAGVTSTLGVTTQTALWGQISWNISTILGAGATDTLNITTARGLNIAAPAVVTGGSGTEVVAATTLLGIDVDAIALSNASVTVTNAIQLRVGDITGTSFTAANNRVVQFGSATPTTTSGLFEMMANFTAAANATPIWISEGATPTRRQLKTFDPGNAGANFTAGQLVCVLV